MGKTDPVFVDRAKWLAASRSLLEREKAATLVRDELAQQRRALPWVRIDAEYEFADASGEKSLGDLFGDHDQLVVYHFMYGRDWDEGCPICSFWADSFASSGIQFHLDRRGTAFACTSNATVDQIETYRARMGWEMPWYSTSNSTFTADMGMSRPAGAKSWKHGHDTVTVRDDERPGLSVFNRTEDGRVGLSYQTFARGLEPLNVVYGVLDFTAAGRNEDGLGFPMAWITRSN